MPQPRKPKILHDIQGTGRKGRMEKRANELQVPPGAPEPYEWLLPEAQDEWRRLVSTAEYAACLAPPDAGTLAIWCQYWAKWVRGERGESDELGGRQLMTMLQAGRLLGLNPQDRCKIKTPAPAEKADNPWAELEITSQSASNTQTM